MQCSNIILKENQEIKINYLKEIYDDTPLADKKFINDQYFLKNNEIIIRLLVNP